MICHDMETLLNMQIDGMLSQSEQEQLLAHLKVCPQCAQLAREYAGLEQFLAQEITNVSVPDNFTEQVMARIAAEPTVLVPRKHKRTLRKGWHWMGGVAVAAALVFGAMVGGFFDQNQLISDGDSPQIAAKDPTQTVVADLFQKIENKYHSDLLAQKENNQVQDPVEENTPEEEETENTTTVEEQPTTYGNGISLPKVAYGSTSQDAYALTTLAAIDEGDVVRPRINGNTVTFYVKDGNTYLEYQMDISASEEPVFIGESEGLPSAAGVGKATDKGYQATAADGTIASNQADGLWLSSNGEEAQLATANGGGSLVSWATDNNKVLFSTASGALCLYYRAENICLTLHDSAVTSASWGSDCKTIVFSATGSNGYSCIFKVTVP